MLLSESAKIQKTELFSFILTIFIANILLFALIISTMNNTLS